MEKIENVRASGTLDLKLPAPGVENLEFIATELHPCFGPVGGLRLGGWWNVLSRVASTSSQEPSSKGSR